MKQKPLVSILVPVHNAAPHLAECLRSIKKQTFRNIEIIAIDDSSTDKSFSILRKLKTKEKRLRIYRNVKRYGIAVTMNRLLEKAKGSYIAFASTNDVFTKDKLKKQLEFLNKNTQVVAVGTQCLFINEKGTHNWTLDEFDAKTDTIQGGETDSVEFTADKAGTFEYYCGVGNHRAQGMVGKLMVE